jgi:uncharacterized protein
VTTQALSQEVIDEFVGVAHGDFPRTQALLALHPELAHANATWVETGVQAGAQMGRRDIVEALLAAGAPLDICTAAMLGQEDTVAAMLAADPSQAQATGAHGIPVLYFPAIAGHRAIAERLLAAGAAVNAGVGGDTPLHGAAAHGQTAMARWLLDHGADPAAVNSSGQTPHAVAEAAGHADTAALLAAE